MGLSQNQPEFSLHFHKRDERGLPYCPSWRGEIHPKDEAVQEELKRRGLIVLQYSNEAYHEPVMDYPLNPNGSIDAVAGICDETGRLLGMMPHPEAYLHRTNHPRWTREELPEEGMGVAFFRNAVQYIRNNLL